MEPIGYTALIKTFPLDVLRPWVTSYLLERGDCRSRIEGGRREELFPPRYLRGKEWADHLVFALKHEELNVKEPKSSYEIEHLQPGPRRMARFVEVLRRVGEVPCFSEEALVALQEAIVEERYASRLQGTPELRGPEPGARQGVGALHSPPVRGSSGIDGELDHLLPSDDGGRNPPRGHGHGCRVRLCVPSPL